MKRILFLSFFAIACIASHGQVVTGKSIIPRQTYYLTGKDNKILQYGNSTLLIDAQNGVIIHFKDRMVKEKGKDKKVIKDTLLDMVTGWLSITEDDNGDLATPVIRYIGTTIDFFTSLSEKELRKLSSLQKAEIKQLIGTYRTISILGDLEYIYKEDMSPDEIALMEGKTVVKVKPKVEVTTEPEKEKKPVTPKPKGRRTSTKKYN